jgi:uncharacterized membrane protein
MGRLRDLLIDGALLALPIGAAAYLLYKAIVLLKRLLAPVAHLLPEGHFFGIAAVEIAAFVVLLLALAALGVFAHSALGRRLGETLDKVVLSKFPGYQIVRSITADFAGSDGESGFRPALVSFDDNTALGFIVEESAAGDWLTVFIPGAPASGSGSVVLVPRERVQVLEVPTAGAMKSMKQRGLGLQQLTGRSSVGMTRSSDGESP